VQGHADLGQVVLALAVGRRLPHLLHGRDEQADEYGDDRNHHQEFNQGEPSPSHVASHDFSPQSARNTKKRKEKASLGIRTPVRITCTKNQKDLPFFS